MTFTQAPRWDIWNLDAVKNFLLRVDRRWLNGAAVLNLWVRTLSQGSPKTKLTKLQLHVAAFFFFLNDQGSPQQQQKKDRSIRNVDTPCSSVITTKC